MQAMISLVRPVSLLLLLVKLQRNLAILTGAVAGTRGKY